MLFVGSRIVAKSPEFEIHTFTAGSRIAGKSPEFEMHTFTADYTSNPDKGPQVPGDWAHGLAFWLRLSAFAFKVMLEAECPSTLSQCRVTNSE